MNDNQKHPTTLRLLLLFCILIPWVKCDFEICTPGKVNGSIYRFSSRSCSYGILFDVPIEVGCLQSTDNTNNFFRDLCETDEFIEDIHNSGAKRLNFVFELDGEELDDQTSCIGPSPEQCPTNAEFIIDATEANFTPPKWYGCDDEEEEEELEPPSPEDEARRKDASVFNQTDRLFKFMLGLTKDVDEHGPHLRLVQLLRQCFKILTKFCDTQYVSVDFGKDVLKAFLFLLRDSDLSAFQDISVANYEMIKKSLDECESQEPSFSIYGRTCKTCATVHSIQKDGQSKRYMDDEFSFVKGKYDIPVDATWGVVNFVHGLCYGTYSPNVNYHHFFQREAERLFTPEIMYRWSRPPVLHFEDLWDHMFSAIVKSAMRNLDTCIFAAYHNTPFLHRLERPLLQRSNETAVPTTHPSQKRKKRSLPTMTFGFEDGYGLQGTGWCLQSPEDRLQTVEAYVNFHCPNNRNALEEVKRLANETVENWALTEEPFAPEGEENKEGEQFPSSDSSEAERF